MKRVDIVTDRSVISYFGTSVETEEEKKRKENERTGSGVSVGRPVTREWRLGRKDTDDCATFTFVSRSRTEMKMILDCSEGGG